MRSIQGELAAALREATGFEVAGEWCEGTFYFESDCFEFSCVMHQDAFEIRNIECTQKGVGRKIVEAVHEYCDDRDLCVFASCVASSAIGFWHKMGYVESGERDEFFRVA